jgi:hypothetical protein
MSADVGTPLVGEKHICVAIEALRLPLQPPGAPGQRRQIGIVGDLYKHVDPFGIGLGRHDRTCTAIRGTRAICRTAATNRRNASKQLLTMALGRVRRFEHTTFVSPCPESQFEVPFRHANGHGSLAAAARRRF